MAGRRPYGVLPSSGEVIYDPPERPPPVRQRVPGEQLGPRPPSKEALHLQDLIDEIGWRTREVRALPPRPDRAAWLAREGERLKALEQRLAGLSPPSRRPKPHWSNKILGEEGFVGHVGPGPGAAADAAIYAPRRAAAKAALKGVGGLGLGLGLDWLSAYGEGARDIDDWMAQEEEFLTGLPGLVSPSELPPPAVLSADRKKAVEATQGMTGVAPDPESDNVTLQEVRAYIKNKVAKGEKLQKWADKITSMESGRLSIKPVNPRSKARQEAAKPQNPRMGAAKRKHGVPTRADTINRENRRKAKAGY